MEYTKEHPVYKGYLSDRHGAIYTANGKRVNILKDKKGNSYLYLKYKGRKLQRGYLKFLWESWYGELESFQHVILVDGLDDMIARLVMSSKRTKVQGWGINDLPCALVRGTTQHKAYDIWCGVLERCINPLFKENHPTYKDCTVCEEWEYFSNFLKWIENQPNKNWQNCDIDKDILVRGNREYSPDTCVFVDRKVNSFVKNFNLPKLVVNAQGKYVPQCKDPFGNRSSKHVGVYESEHIAHKAWYCKKHEYACQLADLQDDPRVAKALRERYSIEYFNDEWKQEGEIK